MRRPTELRRRAATVDAPERIEIVVVGRWNARALLECLSPYRSYLIQRGPEQWVVYAQVPGCRGESAESALAERGIEEASVQVDGTRRGATVGSAA